MRTTNLAIVLTIATGVSACHGTDDGLENGSGAISGCAEAPTPEPAYLDTAIGGWLATTAADLTKPQGLDRIEAIVGDAKLVGLGEPNHGYHELPTLRNAIFQRLVEKRGFRAITLESGIIEARLVDRYVNDVQGTSDLTLARVLKEGFTHNMGQFEETRDLVEWVRKHNIEAAAKDAPPIRWGGKDLSVLGDTLTVSLKEAAPILEKVGAASKAARLMELAKKASALTEEIQAGLQQAGIAHIDPDHLDAITSLSYDQLTDDEQAELGVEITAVLADLDANATTFAAASSKDDVDWAKQMVVVARQVREDLEHRGELKVIYGQTTSGGFTLDFVKTVFGPTGLNRPIPEFRHGELVARDYTPDELAKFQEGRRTREVHLAENSGALVERYGKTFNFAASAHLQRAKGLEDSGFSVAEGNFLAERFKKDYVVIAGMASDQPNSGVAQLDQLRDEQKKRPNSVESRLEKAPGLTRFVFDVRSDESAGTSCTRPAWVKSWLASEQLTWIGWTKFNFVASEDYDAIVWLNAETKARPLGQQEPKDD